MKINSEKRDKIKESIKKIKGKNYKRYIGAGIAVLLLLGYIFLFWSNYFYFRNCQNTVCFSDYLKNCCSARFVTSGTMQFEYKILGIQDKQCAVYVSLIKGDLTNADSQKIIGTSMICLLPKGMITSPEAEMDSCHGILKEGLQDLIIGKMHNYIVQNIGDVKGVF